MKTIRLLGILIFSVLVNSCSPQLRPLKPATAIKDNSTENFKYVFISPTNSLSSGSGRISASRYGLSGSTTSKSVNPTDVITGILAKEGFIRLPELKTDLYSETLIVNYGESGRSPRGKGYTMEVTIQFVSAESNELISSCSAEGQGETEADDIRQAINRCLSVLFTSNNTEDDLENTDYSLNNSNPNKDLGLNSKIKPPGIYYNEYNCVIDQEISVTEVKIKCLNETGRAYDKHTVKKSELSFYKTKHEWEITNETLLEVDTFSYENADPGIYYNGNSCEIDEEISPTVVKIKCLNETGRAKDKFSIKKSELVFHETNYEWKITEETLNNPKDPPGLYYNGTLCTIIKELADGKVKIKYPNESGRANDKKVVLRSDLVEVK